MDTQYPPSSEDKEDKCRPPAAKFAGRDRRRHGRKIGDGLIVVIEGRIFPIIDVSVSGLSFQGSGRNVRDIVQLKLARFDELTKSVECKIIVRAVRDNTIRAEFLPTFQLMKFILGHFGEMNGSLPNFFK